MTDAAKNPMEIVERLCRVSQEVSSKVLGPERPHDCFCGKGGFWDPLGNITVPYASWNHDMDSVEFIEEAVREAIRKLESKPRAAQAAPVGEPVQGDLVRVLQVPGVSYEAVPYVARVTRGGAGIIMVEVSEGHRSGPGPEAEWMLSPGDYERI